MKSWKTTLAGIAAILTGAGMLFTGIIGKSGEEVMTGISSIIAGVGLLTARDNDISSEEAGIK